MTADQWDPPDPGHAVDDGYTVSSEDTVLIGDAPQARGVKTSEFWLSIAAMVAALTLVLAGHMDGDEAWKAIAGITAGYGLSRGLAKR